MHHSHRPPDAALDRLMIGAKSLSHRKERRILSRQVSSIAAHPTGAPVRSSTAKDRQLSISSSVIANWTACRHPAIVKLLIQPIANED